MEFWHYFLSQVQQKEHANKVDPTAIFNFKLQVSPLSHIAYTRNISLPASHCYVVSEAAKA